MRVIERWQLKELVESMRCTRRTAWTGSEGGRQGRQRRLQASAMVCGQSRQGAVHGHRALRGGRHVAIWRWFLRSAASRTWCLDYGAQARLNSHNITETEAYCGEIWYNERNPLKGGGR